MIKTLIEGLLLGLSTGSVCLATCSPIYLPWLSSEERSLRKSFMKIMEISAGRFISYLMFGALAGYFGGRISTLNREVFTGVSYLFLSIFLLVNVFRTQKHDKKCLVPKWSKVSQSAFVLGLITGINFCPSFLIALSKSLELAGILSGVLLFSGFFAGTTLFLVPLAFSSFLSAMPTFKKIARIASIIIALWFFYEGVQNLSHLMKHHQQKEDYYILDLSRKDTQFILFESNQSDLADSLRTRYTKEVIKLDPVSCRIDSLLINQYDKESVYILDEKIKIEGDSTKIHLIRINSNVNISMLIDWIQNNNFKILKEKKLYWKF